MDSNLFVLFLRQWQNLEEERIDCFLFFFAVFVVLTRNLTELVMAMIETENLLYYGEAEADEMKYKVMD
jgi:hypothetical protein